MKISLNWLNDFVDVTGFMREPQELATRLTSIGLEVEAVENPAKAFEHVVVGHIQKLERHPDADRLTVCQLDVGEGELRQIVCGAKNHKEGDKVVVTLPGAVLPGDFAIKKSKIRGVESLGMLASESELGLKNESEGILILPKDAPVGTPFAEYYGLNDVIFEINVTPNRADCLSHYGIAREISALYDLPLKKMTVESKFHAEMSTKKQVRLEVKNAELCPRYSGRWIEGVRVGPSPEWLKRRVESVGLNSINNIVDVTNYMMMELGQPLHAFDLAHMKNKTVIVDVSKAGESFVTLDGTELKLTGDELTIRDGERPVCIAGVIGGKNSGVSETTTSIFLESAHFAMDSVRKTSRRLGIQTDSAYRFSRGTDETQTVLALDRATEMILRVAGGQAAKDCYDVYPSPRKPVEIETSTAYVAGRLGYDVDAKDFSNWMRRLGCEIRETSEGRFAVLPPSFRKDIEMDVDLVEEYGRLSGYDKIPDALPVLSYAPLKSDENFVFETRVTELAKNEGFCQAVNYGFIGSQYQKRFLGAREKLSAMGLKTQVEDIALRNPLNEELDVMRVSLVPGLFKNLIHNVRYGVSPGRIFELGQVFRKEATAESSYAQEPRLALMAWGEDSGLWQSQKKAPLFYDLKTAIENICHRLQAGGPKGLLKDVMFGSLDFRPIDNPPEFLHPAQSASVFVEGKVIGYVGAIHPRLLADEKITHPAAVAELDLSVLKRGQPRPLRVTAFAKFPAVERDLAFVVPKDLLTAQISKEIRKIAGAVLQSVEIFDVFEGGQLADDQRSVAYRMVFQDPEGTLSDEALQALQKKIVDGVSKKLGVQVR